MQWIQEHRQAIQPCKWENHPLGFGLEPLMDLEAKEWATKTHVSVRNLHSSLCLSFLSRTLRKDPSLPFQGNFMHLKNHYLNKPFEMEFWNEETGDTRQPQSWGICAPQSLENIFVSNTSVGCNPHKPPLASIQSDFPEEQVRVFTLVIISSVTKLTSDSHLKKTQPRFWHFPWSRKSQSSSLGWKPHLCHSGKTKALPWREQLSHSLVLNTKAH